MYILIDNFDSFTYNLYQYIMQNNNEQVTVIRNNLLENFDFYSKELKGIFISPGPGHPDEIPQVINIIKKHKQIPILGICLGHQAIGRAFNSEITYAKKIVHGKQSKIKHNPGTLFQDIPEIFTGGRYHSLVIDKTKISEELEITAIDLEDKEIMAVKHKKYPVFGVQFHPESILTPEGETIIKNFIQFTKKEV